MSSLCQPSLVPVSSRLLNKFGLNSDISRLANASNGQACPSRLYSLTFTSISSLIGQHSIKYWKVWSTDCYACFCLAPIYLSIYLHRKIQLLLIVFFFSSLFISFLNPYKNFIRSQLGNFGNKFQMQKKQLKLTVKD